VVRALATAFHPYEPPAQAIVYFLNTLARTGQGRVLVRICGKGKRCMRQREEQEQSDGPLNRRNEDAAQEGHISMYTGKVPITLQSDDDGDTEVMRCVNPIVERRRGPTAL